MDSCGISLSGLSSRQSAVLVLAVGLAGSLQSQPRPLFAGVKLEYAVLDMSPVGHIDATGIHALEGWIEEFARNGTQVVLCNPSAKVVKALEIAGVPDMLGRDYIFVTVHDAVSFCSRQLVERGIVMPLADAGTNSASNSSD